MVATKLPKNLQVYDCSIISETRLIMKVSVGGDPECDYMRLLMITVYAQVNCEAIQSG